MASNFDLGAFLKQIFDFVKQDQLTRVGPDLLSFVNFVEASPTDLLGGNLQLGKFGAALLADEQQVATDTGKFAIGLIKTALQGAISAAPPAATAAVRRA
jgi:hypothetical protein